MNSETIANKDMITKFIGSWISIFIFSMVILLVSIVQILIFTVFNGSISGFESGDKNSWIAWAYILISLPFGLASVLGTIYSIRGATNFLPYAIIVEVGYFLSGMAAGMMFSAIAMLAFVGVNIFRYIKVKAQGPDYEINSRLVETIMWIVIFFILIAGIISIELDTSNKFWWNTNVYGETNIIPYLDVVTTMFTFGGVMMILSKNKYAYLSFVFCDILFLILFANAHQWSNLVVTVIYIILEVLGFIVWHRKS